MVTPEQPQILIILQTMKQSFDVLKKITYFFHINAQLSCYQLNAIFGNILPITINILLHLGKYVSAVV